MKLSHWLVLLPLMAAICAGMWKKPSILRRMVQIFVALVLVAICASLVASVSSGILVVPMGNWGGAMGWVWVIDKLSLIFLAATSLGFLLASLCQSATTYNEEHFLQAPFLFLLVAGMNLAICSGDLVSLVVGVETALFSAYSLFSIGAKYLEIRRSVLLVGIHFLGTLLWIGSLGVCYGVFRSFSLAQIASRVHAFAGNGWFILFSILFFGGWCAKVLFVPLLLGSENIQCTLKMSVGAFLAGIVSKLGFYVLLRMEGSILPHDLSYVQGLVAGTAIIAAWHTLGPIIKEVNVGGIVSSLILGQVSIVSIVAIYSSESLYQAALLFIASSMIVDAAIFLSGCALARAHDSDDILSTGGQWSRSSGLSILWIVLILVVIGVPPLGNFWGRYVVLMGQGNVVIWQTVAVMIMTFVMFLVMLKVWRLVFFGGGLFATKRGSSWKSCAAGAFFLMILSLLGGLAADKFQGNIFRCATEILDRPAYHAAVMEALRIF